MTIENFIKTKDGEIKQIVGNLGNHEINEKCQFSNKNNIGKKIIEEVISTPKRFKKNAQNSPAISLIDVVMASGRDYKKIVAPAMQEIRKAENFENYNEYNSIENLFSFLIQKGHLYEFYNNFFLRKTKQISQKSSAKNTYGKGELHFVKKVLHFNDGAPKKMFMLLSILIKFREMKVKGVYNTNSDYELIHKWAIDPRNNFEDKNGVEITRNIEHGFGEKIPYIGVATIQHIRMHFGVNTFKPDQRVKEVLLNKFLLIDKEKVDEKNLSNVNAILMMERIRKSLKACYGQPDKLILDSILVNYGSGYSIKE